MALAESLGLEVSHADRKLCRQKTQGKPWGFFKTHCSEHLLQSSAKASGDTVYSEVMRSVSSSRVSPPFPPYPHPTFPVFVLYRPGAAKVRVKARAGWCFCAWDKHSGVNNPEDLIHLTSTAYKSTNSRRPQRSQKGKWGRNCRHEPHSLYFYGQEHSVWGPYKAVSAPRPGW